MRFHRKGRPLALLWALCIICTLFKGICFDNVQADSCLAYQDMASGSMDDVEAAALRAPQKGVPGQQAYVPEDSDQGSSALMPRRITQRLHSRGACGNVPAFWQMGMISSAYFFGQIALSSDGLCEVVSNTVIVHYIHGQDGEKSRTPLYL